MRNIKKLMVVGMSTFAIASMFPIVSQAAEMQPIVISSQNDCKFGDMQDVLKQVSMNGTCNLQQLGQLNSNLGELANCPLNGNLGQLTDCPLGNLGNQGNNGNQNNSGGTGNQGNNGSQENNGQQNETGNQENNNNQQGGTGNQGNNGNQGENIEQTSYAKQVLSLVNVEREKNGLAPLAWNEQVAQSAMVRANEIQTSFSHTRPNGSDFSTALKENGVNYRSAGENIAWGQKTPEEVVTAWLNSEGHRANIMNKNFTNLGVGYVKNANGTPYWVQLFTN